MEDVTGHAVASATRAGVAAGRPAVPLVACVVLNRDRREDTLACLQSIESSSYPRVRTILLDAGSSDGSVPAVRRAHPDVEVIELTDNLGYAGNNNTGIAAALKQGAEWVFVLNEDTVLDPECISRLVGIGEGDPGIGILGPMVYHHDEPEVIQSAGGRLTSWWISSHAGANDKDRGQFDMPREVEWVTGCTILVRRAAIDQVGMLDPRFYYYWDETEWCVRARQAGWRILHVPAARAWHKGVQREYRPSPSVTYYATRNRLLMLQARGAPLAARAVAWLQMSRTLASWTIRPKWRDRREHRDAMWQGLRDFLGGRWGRRPGA